MGWDWKQFMADKALAAWPYPLAVMVADVFDASIPGSINEGMRVVVQSSRHEEGWGQTEMDGEWQLKEMRALANARRWSLWEAEASALRIEACFSVVLGRRWVARRCTASEETVSTRTVRGLARWWRAAGRVRRDAMSAEQVAEALVFDGLEALHVAERRPDSEASVPRTM